MRTVTSIACGALLLVVVGALPSLASPDSGGGGQGPARLGPHALLDVPYVSQTPELCGGAAMAMVLRYWGARGVFAQDFASLVRPGDDGILTGTLIAAIRDRGWQAFVMPVPPENTHAVITEALDRGRPLIALVEVAPRVYHFVVIVGATDKEVVVHDPARAPYRVVPWTEFDRAWTATRRWIALVLPPPTTVPVAASTPAAPPTPDAPGPSAPSACGPFVEQGVQLALAGDAAGAERELLAATRLCPADPAAWRELAGLRFAQSRWPEARDLALNAVSLDPHDAYAWQLLASSRYLDGDASGALAAWNHAGEPRVDTIDVHGATRTRQPVLARALGLEPRSLLTPAALGRAQKRIRSLPIASSARVKYRPIDDGLAAVDVFIDERKTAPGGIVDFAVIGARALLVQEVRLEVAGLLGAGEHARAAWRYSANRPRVSLTLAFPSPRWLPGVVTVDGSWERQSYEAPEVVAPGAPLRQERRRVAVRVADWATSWFRWEAGVALDRLRDDSAQDRVGTGTRTNASVEGQVGVHLASDLLTVALAWEGWIPTSGHDRFFASDLLATWRSTSNPLRPSWSTDAGVGGTSSTAPLALWLGAGTGQGRAPLLRAHPLLSDGVVTGPVFGRRLAHATVEHTRPIVGTAVGALSWCGFVDAAQAWRRMAGSDPSPLFVDAGIGIRLVGPGLGGTIRIDLARGLRGGGTTLSASWGGAGRR